MPNQWEPISNEALCAIIGAAQKRMTSQQSWLWQCIRVPPQKWHEASFGAEGGGFWAVGIIGTMVIWYNDIEDGFNQSPYRDFGTIGEYLCHQDGLEHAMERLLHQGASGPMPGR